MKENKLIAEFMGAKFNDEGFAKITKITHNGAEVLKLKEDDFEYDFSWDWLMPVVERIKDIEYTRRGYDDEMDKINNVLTCDLRIENLYNAVVEFIKEYNK